jgi:hypothetical protein
MAKPIKHTPTLKGKDAINFWNELEKNKTRKVDPETIATIRKNAAWLKSLLRP